MSYEDFNHEDCFIVSRSCEELPKMYLADLTPALSALWSDTQENALHYPRKEIAERVANFLDKSDHYYYIRVESYEEE